MAGSVTYTSEKLVSQDQEILRLLSDVQHLRRGLRPDNSVDTAVASDVELNKYTAAQEMSMPYATTVSFQKVETEIDSSGRSGRTIRWLGKTAVDVAESGYLYNISDAGRERTDCEVAEAHYHQDQLGSGRKHAMISPKMTAVDAPAEVAKAEHVFEDDAVRTSQDVYDSNGRLVARRLESLLVRDIQLEDWVAMVKSPRNAFGKAIEVDDDGSALSIMRLFSQLSVGENELPEGPVSIVESVLPFIGEEVRRRSVLRQLEEFRKSQTANHEQATKTAREWLEFDIELAKSLEGGTATFAVEAFIAKLQHEWGEQDLAIIKSHDIDGKYIMTERLAATLESAMQYLLISQASIAIGNQAVIGQVSPAVARQIKQEMANLEAMRAAQVDRAQIEVQHVRLMRLIARQNFRVGGGCNGVQNGRFDSSSAGATGWNAETDNIEDDELLSKTNEAESWKTGVCRVPGCVSSKPTSVGPCSVCKHCENMYNLGIDPTVVSSTPTDRNKSETNDYFTPTLKFWKKISLVEAERQPVGVPG